MRKTKEVITAVSDICNTCHMAFYAFMKSTERLPTTKELLAAPPGNKLSQGIDRANVAVVRHMYKELEAGNIVCNEDIAVVLARERRDNKLKDLSDKYMQVTVSNMMEEVGEGVGDVCVREYRGGTFGEDGRTTLVYLLPTNINVDILASTDRNLRRMHRANQNLCQQLEDERGNGGSRSVSAAVTPRVHDEQVEAVKIAGMVVREDILAARDLRNVRRGSTYEDDVERKLVTSTEYLKQLPESLRASMAKACSLDMGFRDETASEDEGRPDTISRARPQNANREKIEKNRAYFLTTMCLKALLKDDYRAPHEMMIS